MHHVLLPRQVGLSTAVLTRRFSSVGRALTGVTLGTFAIYFAWTAPPHVTWGGGLCHVGRRPLRHHGAAASVTPPWNRRLGTAQALLVEWRIRLRARLNALDSAKGAYFVDSLSGQEAIKLYGNEQARA